MDVAFDGLRRIAAAADQTSKERIACCCPCVFDIDVWPALELQIARAGSTAGELAAALVFVREMYDSLRRDLRVYALENTPLTILCDEIEHKERSLANAMSVVRTTEFLNRISPLYLAAESAYCVTSARGPRWESAVVRMELTLVAVNAFSLRHHSDIGAIYGAKLNWLAVAQAALTESEDSDIYKAAFTVADELFAMATQSAREDWTGAISFALGSLIFDAYCNRSPANYSTRSIRSGKGRIPARRPLPDRQIELRTSLAHLRAAVELREGSYRGIAAKALSFLLSALSESGEKIDLDELLRSVSVALELLPGNGYQTARHCVAVLGNCYGARYSLDKYPLEPLPLETVTNAEVNATIEELVRRVRELAMATPRAALDLLLDAAPVLRRAGERARSVCWGLERRLFAQTTALPEDDWAQLIGDFGLDNFARIAVQHAWGVEERAEVALNLAIYGLKAGPETLSLEFIGVLRCEESKVLTRHDSFVCVLEAYLYRAVGADLWNEGSASTAAQSYFESLARFARDGLELSCTDILNRLIDIAALADICKDVLERLPYLIPSLEVLLGEDGVLQIQTIGRRGLSRGNFLDHRFVTTWMRAFKGLRFACALNHPARYVWRRDPEACKLIERVTRLRAGVPETSALHQNSLEESIVAGR